MAFLAVPISWWVLYPTRFGLRLRAVGENPGAVDTAGISVTFLRYRAVLMAGLLCGIAGTYLAIAQSAAFIKDMSGGQGLHRAGRADLRQVKPVPSCSPASCSLPRCARKLHAGQGDPVIGEVPVQLFQPCPIS